VGGSGTVRGGFFVPDTRRDWVSRGAAAGEEQIAKHYLGLGHALLSGLGAPSDRLFVVTFDAVAPR